MKSYNTFFPAVYLSNWTMVRIRFLIIFLSIFSSSFAQKTHNTFNRDVSISSNDIQIKTGNDGKQAIRIKGWKYSIQPSTPELPIKYELVYLPTNCDYSIRYSIHQTKRIGNIELRKSLPQHIDTEGLMDFDSANVPSFPLVDAWIWNKPVEVDRIIEYSGHRLLLIKLSPIQYNPKQHQILLNTNFSYSISFRANLSKNNSPETIKTANRREFSQINRWVLNPENIPLESVSKQHNTFSKYLIVTSSNYLSAADTLALWKQECGYETHVISSSLWNSTMIKDTVRYFYNSINFRPDYVCFLGDHDMVPGTEKIAPPPLADMFATDLYYVCMGGETDFFPDIAYGRISVSNASEAMSTIQKLIHYEKSPPQTASYYQNATHCAYFQDDNLDGYDDRRFIQTSEEIRDYIQLQTNINVQRVYEALPNVNPQFWNSGAYSAGEAIPTELLKPSFAWDGATADVINSMNYGRLYLFHRDHGYSNATGWAHPAFITSQIQYLFNLNQLSLILSINCHTGEFTKPECFAEKMLRLNTGGCFGIFAPSFYSYSGYNDAFSLGIFDGFWSNPGITANFTGSGGNPTPDIDNALAVSKPGDVLIHALIYSTMEWGFNQHTNEIMHYFGDPACTFYTSLPESISATISDTVFCNSETYFIQTQNCFDCIASLSMNNQIVASSNLINDTLSLHFNAMYGDTAYLSITGPGKRPLIRSLVWHCNQAVYAPIAEFSLNDTIECNNAIHFTDLSQHFPEFWFWDFGDGYFSYLQNPSHSYQNPGFYHVKLKVQNIIGSDSIIKNNVINVHTPSQPIFSDTLLCLPSEVTISATSNQQIFWYEDALHQNLLDSGNSIYFNNINQNTSIFPFNFNILYNTTLGKTDNTGNGGSIYSNKKNYLVFSSYENFVLDFVTIYSSVSGNKIIELQDSMGNLVASKIHNFSIGQNDVALNFSIEKAKRYRLSGPVYSNFFANTSQVQFPYSIQNVVSIDSSSAANPTETYYYFYNWKIRRFCFSIADTMNIFVQNIDPNISPSGTFMFCPNINNVDVSTNSGLNANWSNGTFSNHINTTHIGSYSAVIQLNGCTYLSDTLNIIPYQLIYPNFSIDCQNNACQFHNLTTGATQFLWNFDDGLNSSLENPSHTFADTGTYHVTLMAFNNCDTVYYSQNIMIDALHVKNQVQTEFSIFPNPFSEGFYIMNPELIEYEYSIFDSQGQRIIDGKSSKTKQFVNLSQYSDGLYLLEIKTNRGFIREKILKIPKR